MNFNRNGRGNSGKKFERKVFGKRSFDSKTSGRPSMHKATCSECGNVCEVPFKPSGNKPVFCSNCFKRDNNSNLHARRPNEQKYEDRRSMRDSGRTEMHQATCDECGNACEVPFKPSGNKPIFCSNCFKRDNGMNNNRGRENEQFKEQFKILDIKLDRILKILTAPLAQPTQEKPKEKTGAVKSKKSTKKRKSVES